MTDINQSSWSETDASNNTASPAGFPEGMAPSGVNDSARAVMGAVRRFYDHINATKTTAGTDTITVSYDVAPTAYVTGDTFRVKLGGTNTGAATLNVNSLGAKAIKKADGTTALSANDLTSGYFAEFTYDGTNFVLTNGGKADGSGTVTSVAATVAGAGLSVSGSPVTTSGTLTLTLDINGSTEDTFPDTGADFVETYDASAAGNKKAKVQNLQNIAQNSQSTAYTTVLGDANKHILHPSADTTARTFTIASNASVAYNIGTTITFVNQASAGTLTIGINGDTMRLAGAGTTGSRTLAANGIATALKITSTEWIINGTGLT